MRKTYVSAFTQALAGLGWADPRNVRMDFRWGGGDINRIRALAKELVGLQPDIILADLTAPTVAVQRETRTIPIVFRRNRRTGRTAAWPIAWTSPRWRSGRRWAAPPRRCASREPASVRFHQR